MLRAQWQIRLVPADGSDLVKTGPCTLTLSLPQYGQKVSAYGCWIGDSASISAPLSQHSSMHTAHCSLLWPDLRVATITGSPCADYGAPADHLYCPPMLRGPSSTVLRTAEEYIERSGELVLAPDHAHRTHSDDPDPIVATFANLISEEEAQV